LKCGEKLLPEQDAVIEEQLSEITPPVVEEIASPVIEELTAVQEPEAPEANIEEILTPVQEERSAVKKEVEPPPAPYWKDIPVQQVSDELPVVEQALPEARETEEAPAPEPVISQPVEEEPVIELPAAQTTLPAEEAEFPMYESPFAARAEAEPPVMPPEEAVVPPVVEEPLPREFRQPQAQHVPLTEDMPARESTVLPTLGKSRPDFVSCTACGQQLPPGSLYCLHCGKSTWDTRSSNAHEKAIQPFAMPIQKEAVRPEREEPSVVEAPPSPPVVAPQAEIPSRINKEPAPPAVAPQAEIPSHIGKKSPPPAMPAAAEIPSVENVEPAPVPLEEVRPKYRPVTAREPMSSAMEDRAPALKRFPKARASAEASWKALWPKISGWMSSAIEGTWRFIKGQQKGFRELYDKLFKEHEPSPVNMSSVEALKQAPKTVEKPVQRPIPLVNIIMGAILYIAFFVFIGIALSRCAG
jgi:hypothetical protein